MDVYDATQRCSICMRRKDEATPLTCCDNPGQPHVWELLLVPRHITRRGWWLMLLFTWDLLLGKIRKGEF